MGTAFAARAAIAAAVLVVSRASGGHGGGGGSGRCGFRAFGGGGEGEAPRWLLRRYADGECKFPREHSIAARAAVVAAGVVMGFPEVKGGSEEQEPLVVVMVVVVVEGKGVVLLAEVGVATQW